MGPINLCGPASGGPGDHQHGGYSHDETCLPARPFNLDDERELTSFFGSGIGIASASKHHDENASHDDNCLLGYGCIGLGLDPGDGDKNALSGASSSFQTWCASYFEEPENLGLDTTYATPKRPIYFDPHQRFCPSNPDLPKDGAPAPSPHISCEVISEGDIVSEKDSRICGSQCCGSSGSCSSGASGPCDEATACRVENCSKPYVPAVDAHLASILQEFSNAPIEPPDLIADQTFGLPVEARPGSFLSGQDSCFNQQDDAWPLAGTNPLEYAQPGHQASHLAAGAAPWQGFSSGFYPTQGLQQPLAGGHSFSQHILGRSSYASTLQGYPDPSPAARSGIQPGDSRRYSTAGTSAQASTLLDNSDVDDSGHPSNPFQVNPFREFAFDDAGANAPSPNAASMGISYEPGRLGTCSVGDTSMNTRSDPQCAYFPSPHTVYTPSHRMRGTTESVSETLSPVPDRARPQQPTSMNDHRCLWQLGGDQVCGEQFDSNSSLYNHIAEVHIKAMKPTKDHGLLCCWDGCDRLKKGFENRSKVRRHVQTHTGPTEEYKCKVCNKLFGTKQALSTHSVTHSEERPFACSVEACGKRFKTKDSLSVHLRNAHSEDGRYKCNICHKIIKDSSNFTKHKRTHEREKKFTCDDCKCSFTRRDQFFRHMTHKHGWTPAELKQKYPEAPRGSRAKSAAAQRRTSSLQESPVSGLASLAARDGVPDQFPPEGSIPDLLVGKILPNLNSYPSGPTGLLEVERCLESMESFLS